MPRRTVTITTKVGAQGQYRVDLPLDPRSVNEQLFEIGLWLVERDIPHQARVTMEPEHERVRVSFPDAENAEAFRTRFRPRLH